MILTQRPNFPPKDFQQRYLPSSKEILPVEIVARVIGITVILS